MTKGRIIVIDLSPRAIRNRHGLLYTARYQLRKRVQSPVCIVREGQREMVELRRYHRRVFQ